MLSPLLASVGAAIKQKRVRFPRRKDRGELARVAEYFSPEQPTSRDGTKFDCKRGNSGLGKKQQIRRNILLVTVEFHNGHTLDNARRAKTRKGDQTSRSYSAQLSTVGKGFSVTWSGRHRTYHRLEGVNKNPLTVAWA